MIFYAIIIVFITQFNCGLSEEKHAENAELFNEFVENLPYIESGNGMATMDLTNAATILDFVEKNVAKKILSIKETETEESMKVYQIFSNFFNDFNKICHNEDIKYKLEEKFKTDEEKVQFQMLLLSFTTRLAFTIGCEALEKHGFQIQMNSLVLAYKHLEAAFPVKEEFKKDEYKFRHYQGAILEMNADSNTISFHFSVFNEKEQKQRKVDFDAIHFYLTEWNTERVLNLYGILETFTKMGKGERPERYKYFLEPLMAVWNRKSERHENSDVIEFNELSLFALKNFAVNLIKLLFRKKHSSKEAALYFAKNSNVEIEFNRLLAKLNGYLEEDRAKNIETMHEDRMSKEILLHFEDAIQVDWRVKESIWNFQYFF